MSFGCLPLGALVKLCPALPFATSHSLSCRCDLDRYGARTAYIEQPHDAAQGDLIANIEPSLRHVIPSKTDR
jgi:hypothetical protein